MLIRSLTYTAGLFCLETIEHKLTDQVEQCLYDLWIYFRKLFDISGRYKVLNQARVVEGLVVFYLNA